MTRKRLLRIIPAGAGTMAMAAPACAAVCPKGIGECPYPGRCFLYVDADGNSICDYTDPSSVPAVSDADSVIASDNLSGFSGSSSGKQHRGGLFHSADSVDVFSGSAGTDSGPDISPLLLTATGLFIIGILLIAGYFILRHLRDKNPGGYSRLMFHSGIVPLLLAVMIVLGNPEEFGIKGFFAEISLMYSGIVYMFGGTLFMSILWLKNAVSKATAVSVQVLTFFSGFLLVMPIAPAAFHAMITNLSMLRFAGLGFAGFLALSLITLIFGRVFCAYMCPAGAIQELFSRIPVRKYNVADRRIPNAVRIIFFIAFIAGFFISINIYEYIGVSHLFAMMFTVGAVVFLLILVLSVFVYRPFCTFMCPYGLVFSFFARYSRFTLKRSDICINCRKCEKVCPTDGAGKDDKKAECYLCGRCIEKCPVKPAIKYQKRR